MTMQPLLPGIETTRKTAASTFTAAKQLWSRSVDRHGLMYTGMLGDGDSKAHKAIVDMQPYGPDVEIVKVECLNHAHKRMGTAKTSERSKALWSWRRSSDEVEGTAHAAVLQVCTECGCWQCGRHA